MTDNSSFSPDWISPPGDTISAILTRRGLSERDFADQLKRSLVEVEAIICGSAPITGELARDLSLVLGSTEGFWSRRESSYRRGLERLRRQSAQLESVEWLGEVPFREMIERGWVEPVDNSADAVEECFRFFGVSSVGSWRESYREPLESASFRTSRSFASKPGAIAAWFRQAEILASRIPCRVWDRDRFAEAIPGMRSLTRSRNPEAFVPELVRQCADCGVAVVVLRAPEMCKASGACLFTAGRPMILLSGRHMSDDHFWFTFFHEAGHLVLHSDEYIFFDDDGSLEEHSAREEDEANQFAEDVLVPADAQREFLRLTANKVNVMRFAVRVGVSRGIIVGQLQHRGVIAPNMLNGLKQRYVWGLGDVLQLSP